MTETPKIPWWRLPFAVDTWRRTGYAVAALPIGLLCLVAALFGGVGFAAKIQHALAHRLLGAPVTRARGWAASVGYGLISLPVNLVAFVATLYLWSIVPMNVGFPLRAGGTLENSWGGPTLAGAWAVHAVGALPFLFLTPWVVRGLTYLQSRLAGVRAAE